MFTQALSSTKTTAYGTYGFEAFPSEWAYLLNGEVHPIPGWIKLSMGQCLDRPPGGFSVTTKGISQGFLSPQGQVLSFTYFKDYFRGL